MPGLLEPPCRHPVLRTIGAVLCFAGFCVCFRMVIRGPDPPAGVRDRPVAAVVRPVPAPPPSRPEPVAEPDADPPDEPPAVLIDPGHGGEDGGTTAGGLVEKDWALKIGLELAQELRRRGHRVELTRETDVTLPLEMRWRIANSGNRTAVISIHANSGPPDASGIETFYSWPRKPEIMARLDPAARYLNAALLPDESEALAAAVQEATSTLAGSRNRGIRNRLDLAITSRTLCPSILVECGFLTNATDAARIRNADFRKRVVRGIADGYESWLASRQRRESIQDASAIAPGGSPAGDAEH